jgi:hypothetical protein
VSFILEYIRLNDAQEKGLQVPRQTLRYFVKRGLQMAFIRWRGGCAQLLTTVYAENKSKQVLLTNLTDFTVTKQMRNEVARKFPKVKVDWTQISRRLAQGPPDRMKEKTPDEHLDMAEVEIRLRMWADCAAFRDDASVLYRAADILTGIRQRRYFSKLIPPNRKGEDVD